MCIKWFLRFSSTLNHTFIDWHALIRSFLSVTLRKRPHRRPKSIASLFISQFLAGISFLCSHTGKTVLGQKALTLNSIICNTVLYLMNLGACKCSDDVIPSENISHETKKRRPNLFDFYDNWNKFNHYVVLIFND